MGTTWTDGSIGDLLASGLVLVLALVHVYLGFVTEGPSIPTPTQSFVVAGVFLLGFALYFTDYWHPVLYLLTVFFLFYLGFLWLFSGMRYFRLGVVTGVVATTLVGVALSLFLAETRGD